MTLEERLNSLYPVKELTDEECEFMRSHGIDEEFIALGRSSSKMNATINKKLREAYLAGRAEKDLYD